MKCLHECVSDCNRKIEVDQLLRVPLDGDELFYIRVIDSENARVCASSRAALLDDFSRHIECSDKGDGAARNTHGGSNRVSFRSQTGKRKAGAAAALMD